MSGDCKHPNPMLLDGAPFCPHCVTALCRDCDWVELRTWGSSEIGLVRGRPCDLHGGNA